MELEFNRPVTMKLKMISYGGNSKNVQSFRRIVIFSTYHHPSQIFRKLHSPTDGRHESLEIRVSLTEVRFREFIDPFLVSRAERLLDPLIVENVVATEHLKAILVFCSWLP